MEKGLIDDLFLLCSVLRSSILPTSQAHVYPTQPGRSPRELHDPITLSVTDVVVTTEHVSYPRVIPSTK